MPKSRQKRDTWSKCPWAELEKAIRSGNTAVVKDCLQKGMDPNMVLKSGMTALHLAVMYRHDRCARLLLENGARADIHEATGGHTPLHGCARWGYIRIAQTILEFNSSREVVNAQNNQGHTPLHLAVVHKDETVGVELARVLLDCGANWNISTFKRGTTPFVNAIQYRKLLCLQTFLEKGANPNLGKGWPLHHASDTVDYDLAKLLLMYGAKVDVWDQGGFNPMFGAVFKDNVRFARLLYDFGMDPMRVSEKLMLSPYQVALAMSKRAGSTTETFKFFENIKNRPRRLQDLCRLCIRDTVQPGHFHLLCELKEYLTLVMYEYLLHKE
ncbi:ankyrin repeat and SOCS box protein 7-like isoform X2 [Branchiostoma floridae x Branchiostoma belcheri]